MMAICCIIGMTACSNDDPQPTPEPDPNADPTLSQDTLWKKDLVIAEEIVFHPFTLVGFSYRGINLQINPRKDGIEVLDNEKTRKEYLESDWYFEFEDKEYRLGEVIPIKGNKFRIRFMRDSYTQRYVISPCDIPPAALDEGPIHYSFRFVWPAQDINQKMVVYAEAIPGFYEAREAALKVLKNGESVYLPRYKIGYWVDGQTITQDVYGRFGTYVLNLNQ